MEHHAQLDFIRRVFKKCLLSLKDRLESIYETVVEYIKRIFPRLNGNVAHTWREKKKPYGDQM